MPRHAGTGGTPRIGHLAAWIVGPVACAFLLGALPISPSVAAATTLREGTEKGQAFTYSNGGTRVSFPRRSSATPVTITRGGSSLAFAIKAKRRPALASGESVGYRRVARSTDLLYAAFPGVLFEGIVLRDARAPSRFMFDVEASRDLRPRVASSGAIEWVGAKGAVKFSFSPAVTYDSSGSSAGLTFAESHLKRVRGGYRLSVEV